MRRRGTQADQNAGEVSSLPLRPLLRLSSSLCLLSELLGPQGPKANRNIKSNYLFPVPFFLLSDFHWQDHGREKALLFSCYFITGSLLCARCQGVNDEQDRSPCP